MADQTIRFWSNDPVDDPYGCLGLAPNPDGSVTRRENPSFATTSPTTKPDFFPSPRALSKDIPINPQNQTWARVYLPMEALTGGPTKKLPVIVYYHGGGFILVSAASTICHDFCVSMAAELPAVVISVEYRLAPEHRLPAAYDDSVEALHFVRATDEEWLTRFADLTNCFLMGTSAGGNIAYHVGLRTADDVERLRPLTVRGMILHQPFFGGVQRTASEERLVNDHVLPPVISDVMWELSLPVGVDRDHEYSNPTAGGGSKALEKMGGLGWKVLVSGCEGDPLFDRQVQAVELMKGKGINVVGRFVGGGYHGVDFLEPSKTNDLFLVIRDFVAS